MIKYNTYGEKNNPTILILTGAGIGLWAYQDIIPLLKQKYFVIIPEFQNGFKDINITINELKTKIDNKFNHKPRLKDVVCSEAISLYYQPASQGAGFLFVQALRLLPLLR